MPSVWLTSDTHFGHSGVCRFLRDDGAKLRPWDNPDEMDEVLVANWNKTVGVKDKVYHLGDVVINRRCLPTVGRLNGIKVLIKGNHDNLRMEEYAVYFQDIKGVHVMDNILMTHIPVHPNNFGRFRGNFHGHMHAHTMEDRRYLNLSVEQTNYTPILFERARDLFESRQS